MSAGADWYDWHLPYTDPGSPLTGRLRLIQQHIHAWLDERPSQPLSVTSMCAGQGHDLLASSPRAPTQGGCRPP